MLIYVYNSLFTTLWRIDKMSLKSKFFYVISGFLSAIACFYGLFLITNNLAKHGYIHTNISQVVVNRISSSINCSGAENVSCIKSYTINFIDKGLNQSFTSEGDVYKILPKNGEKVTVRYIEGVPFMHNRIVDVF